VFGLHRRAFQGFGFQYRYPDYFFGLFGKRQAVYVRNIFPGFILYGELNLLA
jgi:hypothetical protein